jgi:hypothetical protein
VSVPLAGRVDGAGGGNNARQRLVMYGLKVGQPLLLHWDYIAPFY